MTGLASSFTRPYGSIPDAGVKHRVTTVLVVLLFLAGMAAPVDESAARSPRLGRVLRDAPAWYEVLPSPEPSPRGVLMTMPGGGWAAVGPEVAMGMRPTARRWQARGWDVVNITFRAGAASIDDVVQFYDAIRRQVSRTTPICALGGSSGGHLALLLATRRRLACAISLGGPSDLVRLGTQPASDGTGGSQIGGPRKVKELAVVAFGRDRRLARFSPRRLTGRISASVLLATSAYDPLVPCLQDREMAQALRSHGRWVRSLCLAPGSEPFVHAEVSEAAWGRYLNYERLVARISGRAR